MVSFSLASNWCAMVGLASGSWRTCRMNMFFNAVIAKTLFASLYRFVSPKLQNYLNCIAHDVVVLDPAINSCAVALKSWSGSIAKRTENYGCLERDLSLIMLLHV